MCETALVGPTSSPRFNRWVVCHVASGIEHETKGTAQYAYGALSLAIGEGFASKVLDAGHGFPTMSSCGFIEIDEDAARVDATMGARA